MPWFDPAGVRPPKAWKQFLLTMSAVYPLSLDYPAPLRPPVRRGTAAGHPLVASLLIAATLTGLLTFVIMPRYTRLMREWLYKDAE